MRTRQFGMSEELREALAVYAQQHNVSVAQVVREAVAHRIGYDLGTDAAETRRTGRPKKYASVEERRRARRAASKARRELRNKLVQEYKQQEARDMMAKFRESVVKKHGPIS